MFEKLIEKNRFKLLKNSWKRSQFDGLNTLSYKILSVQKDKLFTKIKVDFKRSSLKRNFQLKNKTNLKKKKKKKIH